VLSGIPQGSVLGPLLLIKLMFINDLVESCGKDANIYLFADEGKVYQHILADDDEIKLQASVDKFVKWAEEWLVKINYSICKVMSIMHRGQRVTNDTVYHMKDTVLEKVDKFKDLGVLFDPYFII